MTKVPKLRVSVAMCTYNGARFIEEQLWSIFRQSYLPVELIVSDDNSTDETLEIVQRVYETACQEIEGVAQIKLLVLKNKEPLGVTKNFEQAISWCNCELVSLCDQDDVWFPRRLELMVKEFCFRPQLLLLHHDSRLVDKSLRYLGLTAFQVLQVSNSEIQSIKSGEAIEVLLKRNLVTGATTLFRRELFDVATPFPKSWFHDEWLGLIASSVGEVDFLSECLIEYRQHSTNQVGISKLTLKKLIGGILFPRTERNHYLLARAKELDEYCVANFPDSYLGIRAKSKLRHEIVRSGYPTSRFMRIKPIFAEILSERYSLYGHSAFDVLRDLFQSPR